MRQRQEIEHAMRRALDIASRGPEHDENPQVGCVILDPDSRIVAEGWHRGAGTPHAETDALRHLPEAWRARASELTAVVTLEPCNHTGRTGPCAEALIAAGLGAVAYGLDDPGDASAGGAERLRRAGIQVTGGVLRDEIRGFLGTWLNRHEQQPPLTRRRPSITVKWAQTLDGRAAAADGSSQWITGAEARADVHAARAAHDAILVGTGTLLIDDPTLTARRPDGGLLVSAAEQPVPVVLGRREIPHDAKILAHPALAAHGLDAPIHLSGHTLSADLESLAEHGIRSVFVEGGPTIVSALLRDGLVDRLRIYVAPALLGGPRLALSDIGVDSIGGILRLTEISRTRLGADTVIEATIVRGTPAPDTIGE